MRISPPTGATGTLNPDRLTEPPRLPDVHAAHVQGGGLHRPCDEGGSETDRAQLEVTPLQGRRVSVWIVMDRSSAEICAELEVWCLEGSHSTASLILFCHTFLLSKRQVIPAKLQPQLLQSYMSRINQGPLLFFEWIGFGAKSEGLNICALRKLMSEYTAGGGKDPKP